MKKGFIFIFLCFIGICSCGDDWEPIWVQESDLKGKFHRPFNKVIANNFQNFDDRQNGNTFRMCQVIDPQFILNYKISYLRFKGDLPPQINQNDEYLLEGVFAADDTIQYKNAILYIRKAINLREQPELDPRNDGFIIPIYPSKISGKLTNIIVEDPDFFKWNIEEGVVIRTKREFDKFSFYNGFKFTKNIDFTKNSLVGIFVGITGCSRTYYQKLIKTTKGYEFFIDDIRIGTCRQRLGNYHFVITPKIPSGDLVTFNIKSRYL
jgi:hypothetical protein